MCAFQQIQLIQGTYDETVYHFHSGPALRGDTDLGKDFGNL
jgi:hypothetical protein